MDDETRAEFEEMQKNSAMSKVTQGGGAGGMSQSVQNFDIAGWLAGSGSGGSSAGGSGSSTGVDGESGGEKKRR